MKYMSKCPVIVNEITKNFTSRARNSLLSFGSVNSILAVPTAVANALVIVAILKTRSLQTPSYLLLTSLAFSDLAVGLLGQPLLSTMIFSFFSEYSSVLCFSAMAYYFISSWTSWASIFNITAISVDRYLAIRLKMRYKSVVTISRTKRLLVTMWIVSFLAMASPFIFETGVALYGVFGGVCQTICLFVIVLCYTMSFRALNIHCAQIQPQGNQKSNNERQFNTIDVLKYRRLLKTMLLVVILIFICYVPLIGVFVTITAPGYYKSKQFRKFMVTLGLPILAGLISTTTLNSIMNPVIYMTRIRDLRAACIQLLRRQFRCI